MEVFLNKMEGWDDMVLSMFYSKRHMSRYFEQEVRQSVNAGLQTSYFANSTMGRILPSNMSALTSDWIDKALKWSKTHITLGRFLDLSFTVYNLHRAGQDDLDSHAKRMENRIIRSSTRLADFEVGEMSDYYKGKILPTDVALAILGIQTPEELEFEDETYVRGVNGYIKKGMENNKDVKRGLYMLSIPSCFIFKINLTEFAHVYKERRLRGGANPEVQECVEIMADAVQYNSAGKINRQYLMELKN